MKVEMNPFYNLIFTFYRANVCSNVDTSYIYKFVCQMMYRGGLHTHLVHLGKNTILKLLKMTENCSKLITLFVTVKINLARTEYAFLTMYL